ncbi:MAG: YfiR family protein [Candidatus Acidiferrales bacterium]
MGILILATWSSLSIAWRGSAQANPSSEYAVKAAFLFHFAQFAEWPPTAFKDPNAPLTFCTLGEDEFHGALDESISGKTIENRPLRVQHLKQLQEVEGCHVIFISANEKKRIPALLASLKDSPVLTVGETEHFAQEGGMIGLSLEENKIRFEINLGSVEHAKLKLSSRLLTLAKTVLGGSRMN